MIRTAKEAGKKDTGLFFFGGELNGKFKERLDRDRVSIEPPADYPGLLYLVRNETKENVLDNPLVKMVQ